VALLAAASMTAYGAVAYAIRARARRERPPAVAEHRGLAAYSPYLIWVPYVVLALHPGPEIGLPTAVRWLGVALIVLGPALMVWAAATLGRHFDVELVVHGAHEVVRTGPYGIVRHPIYAGMALHFIGAILATGNWLFILGTLLVSFPALYQRAAAEERLLRETLGEAYARYAREVPMLLPRPLRLPFVALALASCSGPLSVLDPAGPRAARIVELAWLMTALAAVALLVVVALLVLVIARGLQRAKVPAFSETWLIVGGGIVLPGVILPVLWTLTLLTMRDLERPPEPPALTVEVVGRQWYYEVRYPDHGITLTNELRIPADRVVRLRLRSDDVIHSFWVPRLMEKVDMVPGRTNETWLSARPGTYRAQCSEFCGLFHARHVMEVQVLPPDDFARWLAQRRR
jgi:cytochrome c oxidase subunit II